MAVLYDLARVSAVAAPSVATPSSALTLRGGADAATAALMTLRGGDAATSSALMSVASNTLAMCLFAACIQRQGNYLSRQEELLYIAVAAFLTYFLVYLLLGFVPMGYVAGSSPLLPRMLNMLQAYM